MSRIDELITRHCPEGVDHFSIGDVAETVAGLSGKTKADFSGGNARFVSYKNAFANLAVDQHAPDFVAVQAGERQNRLIQGDIVITGSSESLDEVGLSSVVTSEPDAPLYLNSFCFALRLNDPAQLIPDFSKYLFRSEAIRKQIKATANGVTRINISKGRFLKVRIPVPPLDVQREIVRVLDQFTLLNAELEGELEAELKSRRLQYEHYRESLLAFSESTTIQRTPLGDLGEFTRGNGLQKRDLLDFGVPAIHYGQIHTLYGTWTTQTKSFVNPDFAQKLRLAKPGDLVIATTSEDDEAVGKAVAWIGNENAAVSGDAYIYRHCLNPKYVAYFFQTDSFRSQKMRNITGTKVRRVSGDALAKIILPVPAREEQNRIVAILDKFDALVNDLSIDLPAEILAQRKQYEYYRDRLLTFEEAVA